MKVSKKAGIALFVTTAVIMAVLIVFHKNPGPAADPGQELAKKIISCGDRGGMLCFYSLV